MKARLDVLLMVALTGVMVALFAAIANREAARPLPTPLAPTPPLLPTVTPVPSPTGGWWDAVSMTPPALPALPGVPAAGAGGLGGLGGASGGAEVAFSVVACPQPTVKITKIVTGKPPWWHVYGTATIPNLEYWKAELSADGQGWTMLYRSAAPVADGLLLEFHTRTVPKGTYQLRLLAVDRTGNYGAPCTVQITIR